MFPAALSLWKLHAARKLLAQPSQRESCSPQTLDPSLWTCQQVFHLKFQCTSRPHKPADIGEMEAHNISQKVTRVKGEITASAFAGCFAVNQ